MISVFLPVEDYCLNYESKVENSFVNAIPPQKSLSHPQKKYPVSSRSHPRRSPRKASAYLPASPPSYPEESSQSLPAKKRISPHLASTCTKRKLSYTLQLQSPPVPYRSRVHRLSPSQRSLSRLPNDPLQTLTNSPPFDPHQNEQNERRNHPALYPPTNTPSPEYFLPVYEGPAPSPSAPSKTTLR